MTQPSHTSAPRSWRPAATTFFAGSPVRAGRTSSGGSASHTKAPSVGLGGSFRYDLHSGDVWWSAQLADAFGRMRGFKPAGFEAYLDLVHPEDRPAVTERVERALEERSGFDGRERVMWPDGSVVELRSEAAVECDPVGRPAALVGRCEVVAVVYDAADDGPALRRAAADIAHDLRNILQSMRSGIDLYLTELELARGDVEGQGVEAPPINELFERADGLVAELGQLSGRRDSSARWLEMSRWVAALEPLLRDLVGRERSLELQLPSLPIFAQVRPRRLEQCIMNLVSNARDATAPGGHIQLRLSPRSNGSQVALTVTDDGVGMELSFAERAFERGVSSHGSGRGLGLSIVRDEIRRMGGRVRLDSVPGGGTCVEMVLPGGRGPG